MLEFICYLRRSKIFIFSKLIREKQDFTSSIYIFKDRNSFKLRSRFKAHHRDHDFYVIYIWRFFNHREKIYIFLGIT